MAASSRSLCHITHYSRHGFYRLPRLLLVVAATSFGWAIADGGGGLRIERGQPPVLEPRHFHHLKEPDVGDAPGSLMHLGIPDLDPAIAALRCGTEGLQRLGIEDMDLHSANFDSAAGSYSYMLLRDADVGPEEAGALALGCGALKRAYLALAAAAIREGNACATDLDHGGVGQCQLAELVASVRERFSAETRWSATSSSTDGVVTNSSLQVLQRHTEALEQLLLRWETGPDVTPTSLAGLTRLVAERLKLFADNAGQALVLNLLPDLNPHHDAFQAVVRTLAEAGWPRFIYGDVYGQRWRVLARLLQHSTGDGRSSQDGLRVAEVGVEKGQTLLYLNSRPSLRIADYVGVDPYVIKGKPELDDILDGYQRNLSLAIAEKHATSVRLLLQNSVDATMLVEDDYFDLVFIDADHEFLPTKQDIHLWRRKVRKGGIIAGHDFSMHHLAVVLAVIWECNDLPSRAVHLGTDTTWWCFV